MNGDGAPALLVTMDGLDGSSKKVCHLLLRLVQPLSNDHKFLGIHDFLQKNNQKRLTLIPFCGMNDATMWYVCQQENLAF